MSPAPRRAAPTRTGSSATSSSTATASTRIASTACPSPGGRVVFGLRGDGTGELTICGVTDVLDNVWHHVAVQRRRSDGRIWLFVDGRLETQAAGPGGDISYPDNAVPGNFCGEGPCVNDPFLVIGAEKHDAGARWPAYSGFIDEVRLST